MQAAGRARVFFALWPDAPVRRGLAQLAVEARTECGGRATPSDKIHLTLVFVGDIERSRIAALKACAAPIDAQPFELELDALGWWRHNRIVWAGAKRCPSAIVALVAALSANVAGLGIAVDDRPYVPHVTLVRNARGAPKQLLMAPLVWRARELVLVESVSGAGGSRYEVIAKWPFGASV